MIRHSPYWLDTFPKSKRPTYPRWRGNAETKVVVIGGGLTGCTCAYSIAAPSSGDSARGGASVPAGPASADWSRGLRHILRGHRTRPRTSQRTFLAGCTSSLPRFRGGAASPPHPLRSRSAGAATLCRAEPDAVGCVAVQSRRDAGFDQSWISAAHFGARRRSTQEARSSRRLFDRSISRLRWLAAAAASRKTGITRHSAVTRVRDRRKSVEIVTSAGTLRADIVIVATSARLPDNRALRRHLRALRGYAVVTDPRRERPSELGKRVAARLRTTPNRLMPFDG